jgi:hypothetical protein
MKFVSRIDASSFMYTLPNTYQGSYKEIQQTNIILEIYLTRILPTIPQVDGIL